YTFAALLCAMDLSWPLRAQTSSADRPDPAVPANAIPAIPNSYVPMTRDERFHLYIRSTLSPMTFVSVAASAGIGQWRDRPEAWEQGARGYGKRFASAFVQRFESESMLYIVSSKLHEQNRYLAPHSLAPGSRVRYAMASSFLARRPDGSRRFSRSRLIAVVG